RQEEARAAIERKSALDEGQREFRAGGGDAHVTCERERAAEAGGNSVDGREHRLRRIPDNADRRHELPLAWTFERCFPRRGRPARRSAPVENAPPAPVKTTTRVCGSAPASRIASTSATIASRSIALRFFALSIVIQRTGPLWFERMLLMERAGLRSRVGGRNP